MPLFLAHSELFHYLCNRMMIISYKHQSFLNLGGVKMNSKRTILNEAQIELLDLVSILNSKEEVEGLRKVIMDYLASQLKGEIDSLWDNGTLNEQKVESFRTLHERTPYRKTAIPC